VQQSLNKSNKRHLGKIETQIIYWWSVLGVIIHLYSMLIAYYTLQVHMAIHLFFTLSLVFLVYRAKSTAPNPEKERIAFYDYIFSILSMVVTGYIIYDWQGIIDRVAKPNRMDLMFAVILILLILEGCRRVMGIVLPIIALAFTAYSFLGPVIPGVFGHRGASFVRFMSIQYMTTEGVWGSPTQVSSKMIFMFTLFGSFLLVSGAGDKLMRIAVAFAGKYAGGPGKVAVVSSGLMGMVSGSASANVATTGQFTIPMMKKMGFSSHMAGAIEAVASTGGTLAPPVMGAGAFIMAEILGISYLKIVKAAAIPALIYYICAFFVVHYESKRLGLVGMRKEELPPKIQSIRDGLLVIIPVCVLLFLVFIYYPVMKSALMSIIALLIVSWFTKNNKMTLKKILDAFSKGMIDIVTLSLCCATAGIVVGCISVTGLGIKFASALVSLSGDSLWIALVAGMLVTIILGMGLPATAAYVVGASVVAPALLKMGFDPLGTQMFVFYFSCLAQITPPIALASYVGAAIAECNPMKCAVTSMRLGVVALVIPFMFIDSPTLLMEGTAFAIMKDFTMACIGVVACAIGLAGYFKTSVNLLLRLACIAGGLLMVMPGAITDLIGFLMIAAALTVNYIQARRGPAAPAAMKAVEDPR